MIIHKPDMDWVRQEAERIEKEAESKGDFPKIQRYGLEAGEHVIRLMPCYAAHGRLFRKESEHWACPPGNEHFPCLIDTWPSKTDTCPHCEAIDKVLAMFPDLNLSRQLPAAKYAANIIVRGEEEKGVQIVRFTPGVYNWIVSQMGDPKVGDITDIENGVDIKIEVKKKTGRDGRERKEYSPGFIPRSCPLSDDDDLVAKWLEGLFDLDRLKPYPKDEKIGEQISHATSMVSYYAKKYKQAKDEGKANGERAASREKRAEVAKPEETEKPKPEKKPEPKKPASTLDGVNPKGLPSCFAGLEAPDAHDGDGVPAEIVGTFGFNEELEKCLICEHELRCMDAKEQKGL